MQGDTLGETTHAGRFEFQHQRSAGGAALDAAGRHASGPFMHGLPVLIPAGLVEFFFAQIAVVIGLTTLVVERVGPLTHELEECKAARRQNIPVAFLVEQAMDPARD